jgi:hypothetical protein
MPAHTTNDVMVFSGFIFQQAMLCAGEMIYCIFLNEDNGTKRAAGVKWKRNQFMQL